MSERMILDGITLMLHISYPQSHIYAETVKQGLCRGDFIVDVITSGQRPLVGAMYYRTCAFDVMYFPHEGKVEGYDMISSLLTRLEVITLPNGVRVRGSGMSGEMIDGVLHFRVNYNHNVRYVVEDTKMESLELEQGGR